MIPDIPGLADAGYLTSTTALELSEAPRRLAVIGSGYIALELGQLFQRLGAGVTLVQRSARLLPSYDPEIAEAVARALAEQGVRVITGAACLLVEQDARDKRIHIAVRGREQVVEADHILVAAAAAGPTPPRSTWRLRRSSQGTRARSSWTNICALAGRRGAGQHRGGRQRRGQSNRLRAKDAP